MSSVASNKQVQEAPYTRTAPQELPGLYGHVWLTNFISNVGPSIRDELHSKLAKTKTYKRASLYTTYVGKNYPQHQHHTAHKYFNTKFRSSFWQGYTVSSSEMNCAWILKVGLYNFELMMCLKSQESYFETSSRKCKHTMHRMTEIKFCATSSKNYNGILLMSQHNLKLLSPRNTSLLT